jgi:hypothetical protein
MRRRTLLPAALVAFTLVFTMPTATAQTPTAAAVLERLLADEWDRSQRESPAGSRGGGRVHHSRPVAIDWRR